MMPPAIAETLMDALDRACVCDDTIVVEYELTVDEPRQFEARLVNAEGDRVLSIVRDVTESKRTLALNRDLAGRLIASQEAERTRIARDLHDGVCQEVASFTVDISYLRQKGTTSRATRLQEMLVSLERRAGRRGRDPSPAVARPASDRAAPHRAGGGPAGALRRSRAAAPDAGDASSPTARSSRSSPLVALALFRIAQEALRNVVRHGHARTPPSRSSGTRATSR